MIRGVIRLRQDLTEDYMCVYYIAEARLRSLVMGSSDAWVGAVKLQMRENEYL